MRGELQRDWSRVETAPAFPEIMSGLGGAAGLQFDWDKAERSGR
jgi:hypothetical protein